MRCALCVHSCTRLLNFVRCDCDCCRWRCCLTHSNANNLIIFQLIHLFISYFFVVIVRWLGFFPPIQNTHTVLYLDRARLIVCMCVCVLIFSYFVQIQTDDWRIDERRRKCLKINCSIETENLSPNLNQFVKKLSLKITTNAIVAKIIRLNGLKPLLLLWAEWLIRMELL